jgi:hypothetical protein
MPCNTDVAASFHRAAKVSSIVMAYSFICAWKLPAPCALVQHDIEEELHAEQAGCQAQGLVFNRNGRSWLGLRAVAMTGSSAGATYALVRIAGPFHIAVIVGLLPTPLMLYIAALREPLSRSGCGAAADLRGRMVPTALVHLINVLAIGIPLKGVEGR